MAACCHAEEYFELFGARESRWRAWRFDRFGLHGSAADAADLAGVGGGPDGDLLEVRDEMRMIRREPAALFFSILMPVMFYTLFAALFGRELVSGGSRPVGTFMLATFGTYGAIVSTMMNPGISLATARENGWFESVRVSPVPVRVHLAAKVLATVPLRRRDPGRDDRRVGSAGRAGAVGRRVVGDGRQRERIARDLHDLVGQSLTSLVVQAQLVQSLVEVEVEPTAAATHAADLEVRARDALVQVRAAIDGLAAVWLDDEVAAAQRTVAAVVSRWWPTSRPPVTTGPGRCWNAHSPWPCARPPPTSCGTPRPRPAG